MTRLISETSAGLYCAAGDFYIDPWLPVPRAVITHAHGDHARAGSARYLTATDGESVLRQRVGASAQIDVLDYGHVVSLHGARVSLHPAGHILGSAQVRIEALGEVCVISGDYKLDPDPTCRPFETVSCHTFVTESTFGLPVFRWPSESSVFQEINDWWRTNAAEGRSSVVFAYALGKAQRVLAGLDSSIGPIYCHGAVEALNKGYRVAGIRLPETSYVGNAAHDHAWAGAMIVAPPMAMGSLWMRRFDESSTAFVSGHMLIRGARRRRKIDRGFPLSDHADWPGLQQAVRASGAEEVLVTHGQVGSMVRWLREQGLSAQPLKTQFEGEQDEVAGETISTTEETGGTP